MNWIRFSLLLVLSLSTYRLSAQCGTTGDINPLVEYLNSDERISFERPSTSTLGFTADDFQYIPLQHVIMRSSAGTGGLDPAEITNIMDTLNHFYEPAGIQFYQCESPIFVDNDSYLEVNSFEYNRISDSLDEDYRITIYYANTVLVSSGFAVCGFAYYPWSDLKRVWMANSCAVNGSTIVHELGHSFGLIHTHGPTNGILTYELADGSNCDTTGDLICDTDADPNLSGVVDTLCAYTGSTLDRAGDPFTPDPSNIMSYSRKVCRNTLSIGQMDRVWEMANLYYTSLFSNPDTIMGPSLACLSVNDDYSVDSINLMSYSWSVTGGSIVSGAGTHSIEVDWSSKGTKTVSLETETVCGYELDFEKEVEVDELLELKIRPFTSTTICEGDSLFLWEKNDNEVVWTMPGLSVTDSEIWVSPSSSLDIIVQYTNHCGTAKDTVKVEVLTTPVADFSFTSSVRDVTFTNLSTGGTSREWDFDDGSYSSAFSPIHSYALPGAYDVTLTEWNDCDTTSKTFPIDLNGVTSVNEIYFQNLSVSPNPSTGKFEVSSANLIRAEMKVLDVAGRILWTSIAENNTQSVDLSRLSSGIYFLDLSKDGRREILKLVIE